MLAVIFHVGDERFAIDARHVVEILPYVPIRGTTAGERAAQGVIERAGQLVSALDLARSLGGEAVRPRHGSRTLIVDLAPPGTPSRTIALLVERAQEVHQIDVEVQPGANRGVLGPVVPDGRGLVQVVELDALRTHLNQPAASPPA